MKLKKFKINGKEYELEEYFIKNLVEMGHLQKYKDGYVWTKKHIKKQIKGAKHVVRYINSPLYRSIINFYRSFRR